MENFSRDIEITVLSAEDLRIHNKPIRKNAFAVVRIQRNDGFSTTVDRDGANYPTWNQKFNATLPNYVSTITMELYCKSSNGGGHNKFVGLANIPVSDFLEGYTPEDYLHFLSYRLRDQHGERNGVVNLSIRVKTMIGKNLAGNNWEKMGGFCSSSAAPASGVVPTAAAPASGVVPTAPQMLPPVVNGIPHW